MKNCLSCKAKIIGKIPAIQFGLRHIRKTLPRLWSPALSIATKAQPSWPLGPPDSSQPLSTQCMSLPLGSLIPATGASDSFYLAQPTAQPLPPITKSYWFYVLPSLGSLSIPSSKACIQGLLTSALDSCYILALSVISVSLPLTVRNRKRNRVASIMRKVYSFYLGKNSFPESPPEDFPWGSPGQHWLTHPCLSYRGGREGHRAAFSTSVVRHTLCQREGGKADGAVSTFSIGIGME